MVIVLQQNCAGSKEGTVLAIEKGLEREADLVVMQEAYQGKGEEYRTSHPGFKFVRGGRVMTAIRIDTQVEVDEVGGLGGDGDVQAFDIVDKKGKKVRLVNVYDQLYQKDNTRSTTRPARSADWEKIMNARNVVLCGDWNAHSKEWNERCTHRRDATFLENLIQMHDLQVMNDEEDTYHATREGKNIGSKIDITLAKGEVSRDLTAETLTDDDSATLSDHMMIQVRWGGDSQGARTSSKITGWDIDKMEEEDLKEAKELWGRLMGDREILSEVSAIPELEEEAIAIRESLTDVLNQKAKKLRVCARSKRWWSQTIMEKRRILGHWKRERRAGRSSEVKVKAARKDLRKTIRAEKRDMWNTFLQQAEEEQVWRALKYTGQKGEETVKALRNERGEMVTSWEEKAELIKQVGFPEPLKGDECEVKGEGFTYQEIGEEEIRAALFEQSTRKAAGPED
jgi:hypothetical protein